MSTTFYDGQGNMVRTLQHYRAKMPLHQGQKCVWTTVQEWAADEETRLLKLANRLPDAWAILPLGSDVSQWNLSNITRPKVDLICEVPDATTTVNVSPWCHKCGQDAHLHPITSESAVAEDARRWIQCCERGSFE